MLPMAIKPQGNKATFKKPNVAMNVATKNLAALRGLCQGNIGNMFF